MRSPLDVCAFVDDLEDGDIGELVVEAPSAPPRGMVFVEKKRVCWAAARGLSRRLTELLVDKASVDARQMEALYAKCKASGRPLGEYLVDEGLVAELELRSALMQHTIESLVHVCDGEARAAWFPRRTGGYSARFTFSTSELLPLAFAASGASHRTVADETTEELHAVFADPAEWGAAFVRTPARAYPDPVAAHGALPASATALLRVGKWASSALDVVATFQDRDSLVTSQSDDGVYVAWRHGDAIIAGRMEPRGPARILNRRAKARRSRGDSYGGL